MNPSEKNPDLYVLHKTIIISESRPLKLAWLFNSSVTKILAIAQEKKFY